MNDPTTGEVSDGDPGVGRHRTYPSRTRLVVTGGTVSAVTFFIGMGLGAVAGVFGGAFGAMLAVAETLGYIP